MTIQPSSSLISNVVSNLPNSNGIISSIFQKLQTIDSEAAVFQASVEIVHQILKCDRVVVYSLQPDTYCQVIAESVTPGYAQLLGKTVKDSCFESGYEEKYQKGRVKAINDVYKAPISLCHLENLEKMQIKANLVVPLIDSHSSVLGLLIVHQCSQIRQWQQSEIELALQISDWIIQQIAHQKQFQSLQAQKSQTHQQHKVLAQITKDLHAAQEIETVLQIATKQAQNLLKCDRVVAYSLEPDNRGKITAESTLSSLAPILNTEMKDPCFDYSYREKYQNGRTVTINNIYEAQISACYRESLEGIAVKSNLVVPINLDNGELYGLLVAHECFQFREWQQQDHDSLREIAFQTGLSLSKAKAKAELHSAMDSFSVINSMEEQINLAKEKLREVEESFTDVSGTLVETNNLNKLIHREISLINKNGSLQTKKDTKLIQLFAKKVATNTVKIQKYISEFVDSQNFLNRIIENWTADFAQKK